MHKVGTFLHFCVLKRTSKMNSLYFQNDEKKKMKLKKKSVYISRNKICREDCIYCEHREPDEAAND